MNRNFATWTTSLATILLLSGTLTAQDGLPTVDEALALSKATGRRILAMAGRQTCPACVRLVERMKTDRTLSGFTGQFIPVKLVTDGNPQWSQWVRKYPYDGDNVIPILYVIRADGEKLYGASGSLPGPALPQMLLATLKQAGRTFNETEAKLLKESVSDAKYAVEQQDHAAAAQSLARLSKLGALGDLKSFSATALEADALVKQVAESAKQSIEAAAAKLNDPQTAFDGALTLVAADGAFGAFPEIKSQVTTQLREASRDEALQTMLEQAEALHRARTFAASDNLATRRRANDAYALVISRYADTPAAEIARAELTALDPEAEALSDTPADSPTADTPTANTPAAEPLRTWADSTGAFTIEAQYLQQKQGFVQLQKADGTKLSVPIARLSKADQAYLKQRE